MTQKRKKLLAMSLPLISGFFFFQSVAGACVASRDPKLNYFISYERPYAGLFADGVATSDIRPMIVDRCQGGGSYLMVTLALRTQKPGGRTADVSLINKYTDDSCKIMNNPFPVAQTYEEKSKVFQQQYKLLRTCAFFDIVDVDGNEIMLPPEGQPAAKVEVLSPSHIRAEGDFVYMKARPANRFAIGVSLKKECTRPAFIKSMGLEPGDLQALLNTYIAGDASGSAADLTSLGSTRVRLALTPGSELMEVSSVDEPNDTPSWPTTFKTAVEFGSLTIKPEVDGRAKVDFVPMVDNLGVNKCRMGICSNENAFQAPIAGMVEITDLTGYRKKIMDSWYFGASAPSQYQGFLESVSKYMDQGVVRIGHRYSVEMTMVDPYEDYMLFKGGLSQMMIDLSSLASIAGLDVFQAFSALNTVAGTRSVNGFNGLSGPDADAIIRSSIDELDALNKGPQQWPPFFNKTCIGKTGNCFKRGQVKFIKKIGAQFTIGEVKEDGSYQLENLRIYSNDPVNGYVERKNTATPYVDCSGRSN